MKCALTRRLPGDPDTRLRQIFDDVRSVDEGRPLQPEEVARVAAGAEVLICQLTDRIDETLLRQVPSLKCVVTFSVGLDHIDLKAARRHGVRVSHTPSILTEATADLAWTLILAAARRLKPASEALARGEFNGINPNGFLGLDLYGSRLGIIGLGKIGRAVARRAQGFGMSVVHHSPRVRVDEIPWVSLDELLATSDVISLHCPLTEETRHLIGAAQLQKMKPCAVLVNTSRGAVIDEKALIHHLQRQPEFFVGLDVYEAEPSVPEALWKLPNAVCLPHIGSAGWNTRRAMAQICVDEAIRFANGETLRYEVKSYE